VVATARGLIVETRRFPPPWSTEETEACYIVRDGNGQQIAYVYFEQEPGRRAAAKLLTRDEAWRIAANIAKLPGLLRRPVRRIETRGMALTLCPRSTRASPPTSPSCRTF
jgi:hypothetical protein